MLNMNLANILYCVQFLLLFAHCISLFGWYGVRNVRCQQKKYQFSIALLFLSKMHAHQNRNQVQRQNLEHMSRADNTKKLYHLSNRMMYSGIEYIFMLISSFNMIPDLYYEYKDVSLCVDKIDL